MGGKTWSRQEELIYWEKLIPNSPKRLGRDLKAKKEKTWTWVARRMTEEMGADARRKYTPLCVFEHYFQNTYLGRRSPNIGKLCDKYYKHEQREKKVKEEERARALKLEDGQSDASSMTDATGGSESPIELDSTGGPESPIEVDSTGAAEAEPIVINCQYPTVPSSHSHDPAPRSTVPGFLPLPPPPQYHSNQFLTNHDHSATAETVDGRLFMAQSLPFGMGDAVVAPHQGYYSYPHH